MIFRNVLIYWHCQQNVAFWFSNICILWWRNGLLENVWLLIASIHLLSWLPKCQRQWVYQVVHTPRLEFLISVYQSQTLINNTDTCQVPITPAPWAHLPLQGDAPGELWAASAGGFSAVRSYGSSCRLSLEMLTSCHFIPMPQQVTGLICWKTLPTSLLIPKH